MMIVHPKMKILPFTHPHISNLYEFLSSVELKRRHLKNFGNQKLTVAIDFHSMEKILWKSMATVNCLEDRVMTFCFKIPNSKKKK